VTNRQNKCLTERGSLAAGWFAKRDEEKKDAREKHIEYNDEDAELVLDMQLVLALGSGAITPDVTDAEADETESSGYTRECRAWASSRYSAVMDKFGALSNEKKAKGNGEPVGRKKGGALKAVRHRRVGTVSVQPPSRMAAHFIKRSALIHALHCGLELETIGGEFVQLSDGEMELELVTALPPAINARSDDTLDAELAKLMVPLSDVVSRDD
jgi:hypothetical protein